MSNFLLDFVQILTKYQSKSSQNHWKCLLFQTLSPKSKQLKSVFVCDSWETLGKQISTKQQGQWLMVLLTDGTFNFLWILRKQLPIAPLLHVPCHPSTNVYFLHWFSNTRNYNNFVLNVQTLSRDDLAINIKSIHYNSIFVYVGISSSITRHNGHMFSIIIVPLHFHTVV